MKPNSTRWARFFQARLAWVIMTPLGRPVVPEVYISRWTSSALAGTRTGVPPEARSVAERGPSGRRGARDADTDETGPHVRAWPRSASGEQRLVAHEGAGAGVLQDVAHLRRGETPVDGHGDGPEVVGGEDRLEELRAVVGRGGPRRRPGRRRAPTGRRPARRPARPSRRRSWPHPRTPSSPSRVHGTRGGPARRTSSCPQTSLPGSSSTPRPDAPRRVDERPSVRSKDR